MKTLKPTRRSRRTPKILIVAPHEKSAGMDFRKPGVEKRWRQILAYVHAHLPRAHSPVWPYDPCDFALCPPAWAPHTDAEKVEAQCLKDVLSADRAETIKSSLEKWGTTLEQVFHLTTKEKIRSARARAEHKVAHQLGRIKSSLLYETANMEAELYAWKSITIQHDRDEKHLASQKRHEDQGRRRNAKIASAKRREVAGELKNTLCAIADLYRRRKSSPSLNSAAHFIHQNWDIRNRMHDREYDDLFVELTGSREEPLSERQIKRHIRALWQS